MSRFDYRDRDDSFNISTSVTVGAGQSATVEFTPEDRFSEYFLRMVAATKISDTTYEVKAGSSTVYAQAAIPPTDIDDDTDTFEPPQSFDESLRVIIRNTASSGSETYRVQIKGWERRARSTEPEVPFFR